jgi:CheY-like chemotaxis protein
MELKDATGLIVDDEPMLLDIFREWLQAEGCRVLTAEMELGPERFRETIT